MLILDKARLLQSLDERELIESLRLALLAQSRGECSTPMPMHLDIAPDGAEVHMKSSYRLGGKYFALKLASTFPKNLARGLEVGNGMLLLASAETGAPVALLEDGGTLTDIRTAAVTALVARELGRQDSTLGVLGTGIQARLQVRLHARVLDLKEVVVWGRTPERVAAYRRDLAALLPRVQVHPAASPAEVARRSRLLVTTTASRQPLLACADLQPGTHLSAVGSDAPGKQELDPEILRRAALLLVDSRVQCERLGELQHAPSERERALELGSFFARGADFNRQGLTVCDFTGLGIEDLCIAEHCYAKITGKG